MENIHIGNQITGALSRRHMTKQDLGRSIGISASAATYLTQRDTIDVKMLQKIGNILKYNFFKHFPVEEIKEGIDLLTVSPQEEEKKKLQGRIEELEKQLEACKRDLAMQKQENVYLKKINDLLEKK
jgi:transcriptional regulator with XRE-family HTH domain